MVRAQPPSSSISIGIGEGVDLVDGSGVRLDFKSINVFVDADAFTDEFFFFFVVVVVVVVVVKVVMAVRRPRFFAAVGLSFRVVELLYSSSSDGSTAASITLGDSFVDVGESSSSMAIFFDIRMYF